MMTKRIQLMTVLCGLALAAVFARPVLAEDGCDGDCPPPESHCPPNPCGIEDYECVPPPPCIQVTFLPGVSAQKFDFGTGHFIKVTANVDTGFDLAIEFVPITDEELAGRLNDGLGPANCVPYDGATSNTGLGQCGFYHVINPPTSGFTDVDFKVFWNFPTLDQLHNVRLYRAPLDGVGNTCPDGFDCFTQDITTDVFAVGDATTADPGVGGKSKPPGFSDFQVVDLASSTSRAATVKIGLKWFWDTGILFDLKAVVTRNGNEVSSGELLGVRGEGVLFQNAKLRTIPLSSPTEAFAPGDAISLNVLVRNSCLGSPQLTGVARLWYDDTSMSQVSEAGVPTLYLVRGNDDEHEDWDHAKDRGDLSLTTTRLRKKRDVRVWAAVPSCDGPYRSFGTWSGSVPH